MPPDAMLVAIDIEKVRNEVLIEASRHKRRRRLSVLNTGAGCGQSIEIGIMGYDFGIERQSASSDCL
jgi:hypothetical protein